MARVIRRRSDEADLGRLRLTAVIVSDRFAGTERYVVDTAVELARRGHDVHVVGGSPGVVPALLGDPVRWSEGGSPRRALGALVRGGRRDVVHGHLTHGEFVAFAAAPITGGRRIATRHILSSRGFGRPARAVGRLVRRELWAEVAVSDFVARGVRPRSEVVLVNGTAGVDGDLVARVDSPGPGVVLVAQRLEGEKDTDVAVRAFAVSGLAASGWRLAVAGRGPAADALQELATQLGVGAAVDFLGWVSDVPELLRTSTIFVATAPREPCGLSVLEAMAHGLPVVASDAGGHRETVGLASAPHVFDVGDVDGCARHLRALASSVTRRVEYGNELRALQRERFSLTAHVDGLEELYGRAVRGLPPRQQITAPG